MPTPAQLEKLKKLAQKKIALGALLKKRNLLESIYVIKAGAFYDDGRSIVIGRRFELTHKPNVLLNVGITITQLHKIDTLVIRELNTLGMIMVKEAQFLAPAPATVPRVTVPSLAGTESKVALAFGQTASSMLSKRQKESASRTLLAHLGKERMLLLRKNRFIDSNAPSATGKELSLLKQSGRRRAKSVLTMHTMGTSPVMQHKTELTEESIKALEHMFKTGVPLAGPIQMRSYRSTGELKRSIKYKVNGLVLEVYSTCPYSIEIEYGWGRRGKMYAHPPAEDPSLEFIVKAQLNRLKPGSTSAKMAGARAQPFLYPAFLKIAKILPGKINNAIKAILG